MVGSRTMLWKGWNSRQIIGRRILIPTKRFMRMTAWSRYSHSGIHSSAGTYSRNSYHAHPPLNCRILIFSLLRRTSCRHYGSSRCSPESSSSSDISSSPASTEDREYSQGEIEPGTWHVYHMEDAHHHSIVPMWTGSDRQKTFWRDLGRWLAEVDSASLTRPVLDANPPPDVIDETEVVQVDVSGAPLESLAISVNKSTRNVKAKHDHRRLGSITSEWDFQFFRRLSARTSESIVLKRLVGF